MSDNIVTLSNQKRGEDDSRDREPNARSSSDGIDAVGLPGCSPLLLRAVNPEAWNRHRPTASRTKAPLDLG